MGPLLTAALILAFWAAPAEAIVGGAAAPPGRWPWMAAVLDSSESSAAWGQYCGGVVIAARRVLTAAHCALGAQPSEIDVLVGRTRLTEHGGRRIEVTSIRGYPGFVRGRTPSLDAAVLVLAKDAGVAPVTLARRGQQALWAPGTPAWTVGWGRLNARPTRGGNEYFADRLRELEQPIQGDDACESAYGIGLRGFPYLPSELLCAGAPGDHQGPCYGDSGGPLLVGAPGAWIDVGIVSGGDACASPRYFDLDVRVDRISAFALQAHQTAQPVAVRLPRVRGRLRTGAQVRCATGRWRGHPDTIVVRWRRLGSHRVIGRGRRHRVSRRDAASGLSCSVTAANRGGRVTRVARRSRP